MSNYKDYYPDLKEKEATLFRFVDFSKSCLILYITNDITLRLRADYPLLDLASEEQMIEWEIIDAGSTVTWPKLGFSLSIKEIIPTD